MHGVGLVRPLADIQLLLRDSGVIQLYFCNQDLSFAGFWDKGGGSRTDSFGNAFLYPIFILGPNRWDCIP